MKAHITSTPPTALCYGVSDDVKAVLREQEIVMKEIRPDELGCEVGFFLGRGRTRTGAPAVPPTESLLLMADFSHAQMNRLLDALRAAQAAVDFKAVLTPTNRDWTVADLMKELARERAAMQGRVEA